MQVYVKGSVAAVEFYQKAFGAELTKEFKNDDGSYIHAELDVFGQVFALSETQEEEQVSGNTMQFGLHFGQGNVQNIHKAYEVLKEGAKITHPLGPGSYSSCMFNLIDKFGVNWCLYE